MISLLKVFTASELQAPPSPQAIEAAEASLGVGLPSQLREIYRQTDGIQGSWTVTIFEVKALFERNETYETIQYLPQLLYIGNDNGNRGVFVPKSNAELTVFESDLGDQSVEGLIVLAASLSEWFERGCPWSDGSLGAPAMNAAAPYNFIDE